jgi:hypothetical protein
MILRDKHLISEVVLPQKWRGGRGAGGERARQDGGEGAVRRKFSGEGARRNFSGQGEG